MTTTRRLAAILAADIAGFSALMERDEEGTFAAVQALQRDVIEPRLAEYQGRLIKTTGDGFLVEFASPFAALRCALAIQARTIGDADTNVPLKLRIGLNLGDVIIEDGGDIYGEGVNVAARLEALADPGGILVSDKIFREVEGKLEAAFVDCGEQQLKNIRPDLSLCGTALLPPRCNSAAVASRSDQSLVCHYGRRGRRALVDRNLEIGSTTRKVVAHCEPSSTVCRLSPLPRGSALGRVKTSLTLLLCSDAGHGGHCGLE